MKELVANGLDGGLDERTSTVSTRLRSIKGQSKGRYSCVVCLPWEMIVERSLEFQNEEGKQEVSTRLAPFIVVWEAEASDSGLERSGPNWVRWVRRWSKVVRQRRTWDRWSGTRRTVATSVSGLQGLSPMFIWKWMIYKLDDVS